MGADAVDREEMLAELLREVRSLLDAGVRRDLPSALTIARAAEELSVSVRKLRRMVSEGEIFACEVGRTRMIPRSEIERLTTPQEAPRRAPRRVAARRGASSPRAEAERLRAALRRGQ